MLEGWVTSGVLQEESCLSVVFLIAIIEAKIVTFPFTDFPQPKVKRKNGYEQLNDKILFLQRTAEFAVGISQWARKLVHEDLPGTQVSSLMDQAQRNDAGKARRTEIQIKISTQILP